MSSLVTDVSISTAWEMEIIMHWVMTADGRVHTAESPTRLNSTVESRRLKGRQSIESMTYIMTA